MEKQRLNRWKNPIVHDFNGMLFCISKVFHRFWIPMTFKSNKNQLREKSHRRGERSNSFIRNWLWNGAVELGQTWSWCAPSTLGEQFHYGVLCRWHTYTNTLCCCIGPVHAQCSIFTYMYMFVIASDRSQTGVNSVWNVTS